MVNIRGVLAAVFCLTTTTTAMGVPQWDDITEPAICARRCKNESQQVGLPVDLAPDCCSLPKYSFVEIVSPGGDEYPPSTTCKYELPACEGCRWSILPVVKNFDKLNNGNPCDCTFDDNFEMKDSGGKVDCSCGPSGEICTDFGPDGFPYHSTGLPFIAAQGNKVVIKFRSDANDNPSNPGGSSALSIAMCEPIQRSQVAFLSTACSRRMDRYRSVCGTKCPRLIKDCGCYGKCTVRGGANTVRAVQAIIMDTTGRTAYKYINSPSYALLVTARTVLRNLRTIGKPLSRLTIKKYSRHRSRMQGRPIASLKSP